MMGAKSGFHDKYSVFEDKFLREANKRILLDDG